MRKLLLALVMTPWLASVFLSQEPATFKLSPDDAVRIHEFYRLAASIQDDVWPGWSKIPAPLMLVTADAEFLTHHPAPPSEMKKIADDLYAAPRKYPVDFQATFPAFGLPPVIVIGEPANTLSKRSTPWLFTLMHEHFHQLQWAQPGYPAGVDALGLSHGDQTGMWMLNYPFPYDNPEVGEGFRRLRDSLLNALAETDPAKFQKLALEYVRERQAFFGSLEPGDRKYFKFQLWQEGIARYTEVKSAEAAAHYEPTAEFAALPDFDSFAKHAERARERTLDELRQADLASWKRVVVYSFGAAEGFLLDRINPEWKEDYFQTRFSLDSAFDAKR